MILYHNYVVVTHGCIIATLTLFGPDGSEVTPAQVCLGYQQLMYYGYTYINVLYNLLIVINCHSYQYRQVVVVSSLTNFGSCHNTSRLEPVHLSSATHIKISHLVASLPISRQQVVQTCYNN